MARDVVSTPNAPAAIGPYSQAIIANGFVFCAGQTPLVPETKMLIEGDISVQTRQVLENIKAILEAAGSDLAHVVKTTVYLQDMGDFGSMNAVYSEYLGDAPPARTTIQAAALPLGAQVEIEAIALVK